MEWVAGDDAGGVKLHGAKIRGAIPGIAAVNYPGDDGEVFPAFGLGVKWWKDYPDVEGGHRHAGPKTGQNLV